MIDVTQCTGLQLCIKYDKCFSTKHQQNVNLSGGSFLFYFISNNTRVIHTQSFNYFIPLEAVQIY